MFIMTGRDLIESLEGAKYFTDPDYTEAIVGYTHDDRLVYSYSRMVMLLMKRDGMSLDDARDFVDYNTIRSLSYEENAPIVLFEIWEVYYGIF